MARRKSSRPASENRVMTLSENPTTEEVLLALDLDQALLECPHLGPFLLVLKACESEPSPGKVEFSFNNPNFSFRDYSSVFADDRSPAWKELFAIVADGIRRHIHVDPNSLRPQRIATIQEFAALQISLHLIAQQIRRDHPKKGLQPMLLSCAADIGHEISPDAIQKHLADAAKRKLAEPHPPKGASKNSLAARTSDNTRTTEVLRPKLTPEDYSAKPSALSNKLNTLRLIFFVAIVSLLRKHRKDVHQLDVTEMKLLLSEHELGLPTKLLGDQLAQARRSIKGGD